MNKSDRKKDLWIFKDTDRHSPWHGRQYRFDFSYIRSKRLREQIKLYLWKNYCTGDKKPATLRQELSWFKYYEEWLYERGIGALEQIGEADAEGFLSFLHICVSKKTMRPLRLITQKHIYDTVKGIYRWYAWQQPEFLALAGLFPRDVYQRINRTAHRGEPDAGMAGRVMQALGAADNPCLRYGGEILAATGIAPGDLLGLQTGCLQKSGNGFCLHYYHHRKQAFRTVPVGRGCMEAVRKLETETEALRRLAPEEMGQYLFLHFSKWEQVIVPDPDLFRYWLRRLTEREKSDGAGMSAALTCTQLRYARAQDMLVVMQPMAVQELTGITLLPSAEGRCGIWQQ